LSTPVKKKDTLEDWVRQHDKLLEATGVFAAITVFLSQLRSQSTPFNSTATTAVGTSQQLTSNVVYYLVLVSLGLLILLLFEVFKSFPKENAEIQLTLFKYGFLILLLLIGWYFWQAYSGFWLGIAPLLVMIFLLAVYTYVLFRIVSSVLNRTGISKVIDSGPFFKRHSQIAASIGTGVLILVLMLALWLALKSAPIVISMLKL
jgi:hypothetical protein